MNLATGPDTSGPLAGEGFWSERLPRRFTLIEHRVDLLGEPHGFGCLPFDTAGRLWQREGRTWLYTTFQESDGQWTSWVRSLELRELSSGEARRILLPLPGEERAVIHHVIVVRDGLWLALYSTKQGLRAAVGEGPEGPFRTQEALHVRPALDWEIAGAPEGGTTLEINGGHVAVRESDDELVFWQSYDSYHPGRFRGDLAWLPCRLDKRSGRLAVEDRSAERPLPFRPADWSCARCGSNLSSDLRIDGRYAFFYYARPDATRLHLALALSADPLFRSVTEIGLIGDPLGPEEVVEKFQAVPQTADTFALFYESRFADGSWRTGMRRYRVEA